MFNNASGRFLQVQALEERAHWISALFEESKKRLWGKNHGRLVSLEAGRPHWHSRGQGLIPPQIRPLPKGRKGGFGWPRLLAGGQLGVSSIGLD
jgi:hypothetical protein